MYPFMWKRTNTNYYDILKDKCIVYSYGYDLTKKFSDSKGDATKVKFVVKIRQIITIW